MPTPQQFLAGPQPAPPGGYLLDGVPESVVMQSWSQFDHGDRFHVDGGMQGYANIFAEAEAMMEGDASHYDNYQVGGAGVGKRETLPITGADGGNSIGTLSMPPHMSFGQPAQLKDAAGKIVAVVMTAQTKRPNGFQATTVNVWGTTPQFSGQAPTAFPDGSEAYLWAAVNRARMSSNVQIVDGKGTLIAKCSRVRGWYDRFKIVTPDGAGLALIDTVKTDKKKHVYTCAQGVDVAFTICLVAATQMASDELFVDRQERAGPGGGDDD